MKNKTCSKCKQTKPVGEFHVNKATKDGLSYYCKRCKNEKVKVYYSNNTERCNRLTKEWHESNPEYNKEYYIDNAEWYKQYNKAYYLNNTEQCRQLDKECKSRLYKTPRGILNNSMFGLMHHSFRGGQNSPLLEERTGHAPQDVRNHFEPLFPKGMTWANYGTEWVIDHIMPIESFKFTKFTDPGFQKCWALSNLQPLWKADNVAKGRSVSR